MSVHEVAERSRRSVAHTADAVSFHAARPLWSRRWAPPVDRILREGPLDSPRGFVRPERAEEIRVRFPTEADALVTRADAFLAGRRRYFAYPEVAVPSEARAADLDPFSGRAWPPRHGKRIDYRRGTYGDPKWIWELNRCQELPLLVAAWLVSGEARYAQGAAEGMASWSTTHPPGRGIAWSSGFEAALRGISLAVAIDALRGSAALPGPRLESAMRSLWQHGRWVERDRSIGSSANNHLLGEASGLVVIGALAPELRDAPRWTRIGLEELRQELEKQIRPDGTSAEQAFAYHLFVLDLLLVVTASLDCSGAVIPPELESAARRSARALLAQVDDGEPAPSYGDADDGRALALDSAELRDARGVAAGIAARFGSPEARRVAGELDPMAFWLFGAEGAARFEHTDPAPPPGSVTLEDAGLTVLRSGARRVLVDHGPHGYLGLAAHAHADALAVSISVGPQALVGDPGVGSYFGRPAVREAFRGTGFHATVLVDGRSSSDAGGPFLWTRHARSRLLHADLSGGAVIAEHDGYASLEDPVLHRRAVVTLAGALLVVDGLGGRTAHRYSQRWPLHPTLVADVDGPDRAVATRDGGAGIVLAFASSAHFVLAALQGEERPYAGWWSERLEHVTPSWVVSADVEASGAVYIATLSVPLEESDAAPDTRIDLDVQGDVVRIDVAYGLEPEIVEIDLATPRPRSRRAVAAGSS